MSQVQYYQELHHETKPEHTFSFQLFSLEGIAGKILSENFSLLMEVEFQNVDDIEKCSSLFSKPVSFNGGFKPTIMPLNFKLPRNQDTDITLKFSLSEDKPDGSGSSVEYGMVRYCIKKGFDLGDLLSQKLSVLRVDESKKTKIGLGSFVLADSSQILEFKIDLSMKFLLKAVEVKEAEEITDLKVVLTQEMQPTKEIIGNDYADHLASFQQKQAAKNTITLEMMVEMHRLKKKQKLHVCLTFEKKFQPLYFVADIEVDKEEIISSKDFEVKKTLTFSSLSEGLAPKQTFTAEMKISRLSSVSLTKSLKEMYGLLFHLCIAIDFTASNLNASAIGHNLHELKSEQNPYQKVIDLIASSIDEQSVIHPITTYFFGLHTECYIKNNIGDPRITKIEKRDTTSIKELKKIYEDLVKNWIDYFGVSTSFIDFTELFYKDHKELDGSNKKVLSILLIITDGILEDEEMNGMIDLIAKMAEENISIIIVGVGDADFKNMERLDGDAGDDGLPTLTDSKGNRVKRDIVQFVQFKEETDPISFKEKIFYELPHQIISFQQMINK